MGPAGRTLADALEEFEIGYAAIERDAQRLRGRDRRRLRRVFGDMADPRLWESVSVEERRIIVMTEPNIAVAAELRPLAARRFPDVKNITLVADGTQAAQFRQAGLTPVIDVAWPPGSDTAEAVLRELGQDPAAIEAWVARQRTRIGGSAGEPLVAA